MILTIDYLFMCSDEVFPFTATSVCIIDIMHKLVCPPKKMKLTAFSVHSKVISVTQSIFLM